jgi:hypothetical protein
MRYGCPLITDPASGLENDATDWKASMKKNASTGGVMSKFERLLEAGSTELPDCRCAAEMNLTAIVPGSGGDTEIRIFRCPHCSHELRLTAWHNDVSAA